MLSRSRCHDDVQKAQTLFHFNFRIPFFIPFPLQYVFVFGRDGVLLLNVHYSSRTVNMPLERTYRSPLHSLFSKNLKNRLGRKKQTAGVESIDLTCPCFTLVDCKLVACLTQTKLPSSGMRLSAIPTLPLGSSQ